MTKSEKNALSDVVATLNAILNNNDDKVDQTAQKDASAEEIEFIKDMAAAEPFNIVGVGVIKEEGPVCNVQIGKSCLGRMLHAYLEKYDHE